MNFSCHWEEDITKSNNILLVSNLISHEKLLHSNEKTYSLISGEQRREICCFIIKDINKNRDFFLNVFLLIGRLFTSYTALRCYPDCPEFGDVGVIGVDLWKA